MKKLMILLCLGSIAQIGFADTIRTYDDGTAVGVISGEVYYVQTLSIKEGWTLNSVQFHMFYQNPGIARDIYTQILDASDDSVITQVYQKPAASWFFAELSNLNLGQGEYYVRSLCYDATGRSLHGAMRFDDSSYTDGYASTDWNGATPLTGAGGGTQDFQVIMDVTVPEPATMALLGIGSGYMFIRRKK